MFLSNFEIFEIFDAIVYQIMLSIAFSKYQKYKKRKLLILNLKIKKELIEKLSARPRTSLVKILRFCQFLDTFGNVDQIRPKTDVRISYMTVFWLGHGWWQWAVNGKKATVALFPLEVQVLVTRESCIR